MGRESSDGNSYILLGYNRTAVSKQVADNMSLPGVYGENLDVSLAAGVGS